MPAPTLRSAATVLALLALTSPAHADDVRWQFQGSAQVGWTDNVLTAPDEETRTPEDPERIEDGFVILSPTIALLIEDARVLHTIAYGFGASLYFGGEGNSYSNGLSYVSRWQLSPSTDLALGAGVAYTQTNNFNLLGGANQTTVGVVPAEAVEVVSASVSEGIEHALDANWTVNQTTSATGLFTIGQPTKNFLFGASGGFEREWEYTALGANSSVEFLWTPDATDEFDNEITGQETIIARLAGTWGYQLSDRWSTSAQAGGLIATAFRSTFDADGNEVTPQPILQPFGSASLDFGDEYGTAGISVEHNVSPNVLIGTAQLTDTATLRAGLPLGRETGLAISGTGAAGLSRVVRVDGTFGPRLVLFVADGGLSYTPRPAPYLSFDGRYQFTKQMLANEEDRELLDPEEGLRETSRHTVLFGVTFTYPPLVEEAGETPVFRPTPTATGDILAGVQDARAQQERTEELQEKRDRRQKDDEKKDKDGLYGPVGDDESE